MLCIRVALTALQLQRREGILADEWRSKARTRCRRISDT